MKQRVEGLTKNRLKRSSFVHQSKKLARAYTSHLPTKTLAPTLHRSKPWESNDNLKLTISTSVPHVTSEDTQSESVKCALTKALIDEKYPGEAWVQVYTDGSATQAVSNGAGAFIRYPDGHPNRKALQQLQCRSEGTPASVIQTAGSEYHQFVFLTDARSVLEALSNNKEQELMDTLLAVSAGRRVVLQWVPAHCGVPGNEAADQLA
ncbi:hypothetical protein BaRGS_00034309 [Batillaria attramentaria]|uniref:RNase H type-1 domain-containing protein n=1 Tax=Batillaria attramentaria TaxID=370345 RepID=A0ABD0JHX1_9CAEN|nr:hypothetical protein BaRGS_003466 [Batillaria attramentaria]